MDTEFWQVEGRNSTAVFRVGTQKIETGGRRRVKRSFHENATARGCVHDDLFKVESMEQSALVTFLHESKCVSPYLPSTDIHPMMTSGSDKEEQH